MKLREYRSEVLVPRPRDEVFAFFVDPRNLDAIVWCVTHTVTYPDEDEIHLLHLAGSSRAGLRCSPSPQPIQGCFRARASPRTRISRRICSHLCDAPHYLRFRTVTPLPTTMAAGAIIDHRLTIRGLPVRWRSRIAVFEPPFRFIGEQIRGPYRLWVHEHTFEARGEATLIRDVVRYSVPFDRLVHDRLVRPDIEGIFAFRERELLARFGSAGMAPAVTRA